MPGKMKIVALGGCGGMGQFAVRTALDFNFLEKIIIADRDEERARSFSEKCGAKTDFVGIDIEDSDALKGLLSDSDCVITTVGPYYRFGVPILKAAIQAGTHYIDINDDWEPTLEMLELDEAAEKAGITAIIGMGASPGISNLLAVKAMAVLDSVDTLITGWGIGDAGNDNFGEPGEGGTFGAATEHWVQQFTGKIRVRKNGEFREASPMEKLTLSYPGRGQKAVHTLGHPEPVTLPRHRPEIKTSYNVMDFPPYLITILKALAKEVDTGKKTVVQAAEWIESLMDKGMADLIFSKLGPRLLLAIIKQIIRPEPKYPGEFALATGTQNNVKQSVGVHLTANPFGGMDKMTMGAITGVPMAVALKMLAQGSITRKGVFAPEAGIDPDLFFDELAPLCTPVCRGVDDLLSISISN